MVERIRQYRRWPVFRNGPSGLPCPGVRHEMRMGARNDKRDAAKPRPSFKFRPDNPTLFDPSPDNCQRWGGMGSRGCLIWPPENGRHEAVSGGSPELPGVVVRRVVAQRRV